MHNNIEKNSSFRNELEIIASDNTSGSNAILRKLNNLFLSHLDTIDLSPDLFSHLYIVFQPFESIKKYLNALKHIATDNNKHKIVEFFTKYETEHTYIFDSIYNNLKPLLKDKISLITISNSNTVFEILKRINSDKIIKNVVVSESRPQFEGRLLAEKIASLNIKVDLIVEADIPSAVKKIDLCIIGADTILPNGDVINKIGSQLLAISCNYYNKPFYVIADSSKLSKNSEFNQIPKPSTEIFSPKNTNINIHNYYFEKIEESLITEIIRE